MLFLLTEVRPQLVVEKSHRLARRSYVGLAALQEELLIVPPRPSRMRDVLEDALAELGHQVNVALEAGGWELMMHFAALGMGAAVVNGCCTPPPGTVPIVIRGLPSTKYYLIARKGGYSFTEMERLRSRITDEAHSIRFFQK